MQGGGEKVKISGPGGRMWGSLWVLGGLIVGVGLEGGEVLRVMGEDRVLEGFSGGAGDRVSDIAEGTGFISAAGHSDEEALGALDDLDIVDGEVAVDGDGDQGLEPRLIVELANANISDGHKIQPPVLSAHDRAFPLEIDLAKLPEIYRAGIF